MPLRIERANQTRFKKNQQVQEGIRRKRDPQSLQGGRRAMIRKLLLAFGTVALAGLLGMAAAQAASIINSDHDLSTKTTTTGDACVFCHTPHNTADPATLPVPLWNRNPAATASFTMYSSPSIDMVIANQPQGISAACLSCHDGITAFDSLVNNSGITLPDTMGNGDHAVGRGGDLTDDHPISVTYSVGTGAGQDPDFVVAVAGKVGALPLYRAPGATGVGDQVECASCHNVHDPQFDPFLRIANTGSAVCKSCHIK
jgi:predicted CXXCH cytochrome family protein